MVGPKPPDPYVAQALVGRLGRRLRVRGGDFEPVTLCALADARDGPRPARRRTTKARLEELQELRDAGLVSADEADAKRRAILDAI